ncbi:putative mRNA-binding protein PUF3 [Blattamonas nauphoetae]|uniref:mRNA-binding protein PUF3 n=1 Tax=Blattamonas nauphoetae TaxID=2049346 RepID=A0ABQ9XYC2_9EUKA|nr:putative mRNA-binding protein PUF3 [Blattamonas nauphoetae]
MTTEPRSRQSSSLTSFTPTPSHRVGRVPSSSMSGVYPTALSFAPARSSPHLDSVTLPDISRSPVSITCAESPVSTHNFDHVLQPEPSLFSFTSSTFSAPSPHLPSHFESHQNSILPDGSEAGGDEDDFSFFSLDIERDEGRAASEIGRLSFLTSSSSSFNYSTPPPPAMQARFTFSGPESSMTPHAFISESSTINPDVLSLPISAFIPHSYPSIIPPSPTHPTSSLQSSSPFASSFLPDSSPYFSLGSQTPLSFRTTIDDADISMTDGFDVELIDVADAFHFQNSPITAHRTRHHKKSEDKSGKKETRKKSNSDPSQGSTSSHSTHTSTTHPSHSVVQTLTSSPATSPNQVIANQTNQSPHLLPSLHSDYNKNNPSLASSQSAAVRTGMIKMPSASFPTQNASPSGLMGKHEIISSHSSGSSTRPFLSTLCPDKDDPLLQQLKMKPLRQASITLTSLHSHFLSFACDHLGSRFIQRQLDGAHIVDNERSPIACAAPLTMSGASAPPTAENTTGPIIPQQEILDLFSELCPYLFELFCHQFANYVLQKLIGLEISQITNICHKALLADLPYFSHHLTACRVVQTIIPHLTMEQLKPFADLIFPSTLEYIQDKNANHVLQCLIEHIDSSFLDRPIFIVLSASANENSQFEISGDESALHLLTYAQKQLLGRCQHSYGCRVMESLLFCSSYEQYCTLSEAILPLLPHLLTNDNSTFLAHCFLGERQKTGLRKRRLPLSLVVRMESDNAELRKRREADRSRVVTEITQHIFSLSLNKFTSILVEEALLCCSPNERSQLGNALLWAKPEKRDFDVLLRVDGENENAKSALNSSVMHQFVQTFSHPLLLLLLSEFGSFVANTLALASEQEMKEQIVSSLVLFLPSFSILRGGKGEMGKMNEKETKPRRGRKKREEEKEEKDEDTDLLADVPRRFSFFLSLLGLIPTQSPIQLLPPPFQHPPTILTSPTSSTSLRQISLPVSTQNQPYSTHGIVLKTASERGFDSLTFLSSIVSPSSFSSFTHILDTTFVPVDTQPIVRQVEEEEKEKMEEERRKLRKHMLLLEKEAALASQRDSHQHSEKDSESTQSVTFSPSSFHPSTSPLSAASAMFTPSQPHSDLFLSKFIPTHQTQNQAESAQPVFLSPPTHPHSFHPSPSPMSDMQNVGFGSNNLFSTQPHSHLNIHTNTLQLSTSPHSTHPHPQTTSTQLHLPTPRIPQLNQFTHSFLDTDIGETAAECAEWDGREHDSAKPSVSLVCSLHTSIRSVAIFTINFTSSCCSLKQTHQCALCVDAERPEKIEIPRLSKPIKSLSPRPLYSMHDPYADVTPSKRKKFSQSATNIPSTSRSRQQHQSRPRPSTKRRPAQSAVVTRRSTRPNSKGQSKGDTSQTPDYLKIETEEDARRAIATFEQRKQDAIKNKLYKNAEACQRAIEQIRSSVETAVVGSIEKQYKSRLQTLSHNYTKEKRALDQKWKRNFQHHNRVTQMLRAQLQEQYQFDIRALQQERKSKNSIFHPSRTLLDTKVQLERAIKTNQFTNAERIQKEYDTLEAFEIKQFEKEQELQIQRRIEQRTMKYQQQSAELERKINEDYDAMVQVKEKSFSELSRRFGLLQQIEADTYSLEVQKSNRSTLK